MALDSNDRIAFSRRIVSADTEIAGIEETKVQLQSAIAKLQQLDAANKKLYDEVNPFVNSYQAELTTLSGIPYTTISEQDILDGADKKPGNFFYPNQPSTSVPPLAATNNVWVNPKPFAGSKAVGKNYSAAYPAFIPKEGDYISTIQSTIASLGSLTSLERGTGQTCVPGNPNGGTCSIPIHITQAACESNSGVWTPESMLDSVEDYPAAQTALATLVSAVSSWETILNLELTLVLTNDPDAGRQAQNNTEIASINTAKAAIDVWQALIDFYTAHGQTTCAGFNALDPSSFPDSKLKAAAVASLSSAATARLASVTTRISELNVNLGSITQDVSTGEVTASSGFYGSRFARLSLRLNDLGGSLSELKGLQRALVAQDGFKTAIQNQKSVYLSIMACSALQAPASGTKVVHLKDASQFSVGQFVYVFAEDQQEIATAVEAKSGNAITLGRAIPEKYRDDSLARVYRVI